MSNTVRIFVSSPSDVPAERVAVERIAGRFAARYDHLQIEVYRWESGHYFSAHTGFQEQIDALGGFDIVVGILWSRLGAPLPPDFGKTMPAPRQGQPFPSGTAFEILEAIEIRRQADRQKPDILVYRKTAPTPSAAADDDTQQERLLADRKAVNAFIEDFFVNETSGFRAAFQSVPDLDAFEARFEADLTAWLREHRSLGRPRKWRVEVQGSPFRGLDPFDAGHRDVFFGRRPEIERALDRLAAGSGFLLIDGASGTGKSSLARAGVLPRLQDRDPDLRIAVTRPETRTPLHAMCEALFDARALPELRESDFPDPQALARHFLQGGEIAPLLRALDRSAGAASGLVLLVDQCEALFTDIVPKAEQEAFGRVLEQAVQSGRVRVVATLRANAREAALAIEPFARLINGHPGLSLGPPSPDAFGDIVRGPATAAGLAFERNSDGVGLDEVLLDEVARDLDALPLLQFALDQLYERAAKRVTSSGARLGEVADDAPVLTLTHADYDALGGLSGAIGSQAEAALRKVSDAARASLAPLVRELTVAGQGSAVLGRAPMAVAAPDAATQELVEALIKARVLVQDSRREADGAESAELRFTHERVLRVWDRARDAVATAAQYLRTRGDLVRAEARWRDGGAPADLLLPRGLRLAEAEEVLAGFGAELDRRHPQLRGYIKASGRAARRRQRITQAAAAVFALVAIAAGWFGYQSQQNAALAARNQEAAEVNAARAETNALRAEENARTAEANATRAEENARIAETNAAHAEANAKRAEETRVAIAVATSDTSVAGGRADLGLAYARAALQIAEDSAQPDAVRATAERALIEAYVAHHGASARLELNLIGHDRQVEAVIDARDAGWIATADADASVIVFDGDTGQPRARYDFEDRFRSLVRLGDDTLALGLRGGEIVRIDARTGETATQDLGSAVIGLLPLPDGTGVVAYGAFRTAALWRFDTGSFTDITPPRSGDGPGLTHTAPYTRAAWTADQSALVLGGFNFLELFDPTDGTYQRRIPDAREFDVASGQFLRLQRRNDDPSLVSLGTLTEAEPGCTISTKAYTDRGVNFATQVFAGYDPIARQVEVWSLETCAALGRFAAIGVAEIIVQPERLILRYGGDDGMRVTTFDGSEVFGTALDGRVHGVDLSPDARHVIAWSATGTAEVRSMDTGDVVFALGDRSELLGARFSNTGRTAWFHRGDGSIRGVPVVETTLSVDLQHDAEVVAFEVEGSSALVRRKDGAVSLWTFNDVIRDHRLDLTYLEGRGFRVSQDGSALYYLSDTDIMFADFKTGARRNLSFESRFHYVHPSHDGDHVVFVISPHACVWTPATNVGGCHENIGTFQALAGNIAVFESSAGDVAAIDLGDYGKGAMVLPGTAPAVQVAAMGSDRLGVCRADGTVQTIDQDMTVTDLTLGQSEPIGQCKFYTRTPLVLTIDAAGTWSVFDVSGAEAALRWSKQDHVPATEMRDVRDIGLNSDLVSLSDAQHLLWIDLDDATVLYDQPLADLGAEPYVRTSADGQNVAVIGDDEILVFRRGGGAPDRRAKPAGQIFYNFLGDGSFALLNDDGSISVVDPQTLETTITVGQTGRIRTVQIVPDWDAILTTSDRSEIAVWDISTGALLMQHSGGADLSSVMIEGAPRFITLFFGNRGPQRLALPDRAALMDDADAVLGRTRPVLGAGLCALGGPGVQCPDATDPGPMIVRDLDTDMIYGFDGRMEISVLRGGEIMLVSDKPMHDIMAMAEYSDDEQRLVLHDVQGNSGLMPLHLPASIIQAMDRSDTMIIYMLYEDSEPLGYRLPLVKY